MELAKVAVVERRVDAYAFPSHVFGLAHSVVGARDVHAEIQLQLAVHAAESFAAFAVESGGVAASDRGIDFETSAIVPRNSDV